MGRLAEYMRLLAGLFGQEHAVHFANLESGSTVVVSRIDYEARPKVLERVQRARSADISDDGELGKIVVEINRYLRADNAEGKLYWGQAQILEFPGKKAPIPQEVGPFNKHTILHGILMRIGGEDDTSHGLLKDFEGRTWKCQMTRDMAIQIAKYLYTTPLKLSGEGRWFRSEDANWALKVLKANEYETLPEISLTDSVAQLRAITADSDRHPLRDVSSLLSERKDH
ncbi:hypothetical protein [Sinimarinibacterium flocculans]|uniref:Uncharacterized protein n=2 Tax=Sinimarinibacterium flocculans TaxID=985250 RepID=A0A318EBE6_9GAMM|nr:hypothetical protein [Sinimarinibacterium flocculans]PXV67044.1 hypothetical protein C8D93_10617 [Sinimarinibacterium flocculans]